MAHNWDHPWNRCTHGGFDATEYALVKRYAVIDFYDVGDKRWVQPGNSLYPFTVATLQKHFNDVWNGKYNPPKSSIHDKTFHNEATINDNAVYSFQALFC